MSNVEIKLTPEQESRALLRQGRREPTAVETLDQRAQAAGLGNVAYQERLRDLQALLGPGQDALNFVNPLFDPASKRGENLLGELPDSIIDELGFPRVMPGRLIAPDVQFAAERKVAERNARLGRQATQAIQFQGLGNLQTRRPGSAAMVQSPLVGALANSLLAQRTQAPDLMFRYRENELHRARKAGQRASELALVGGIIQGVTTAGAIAATVATGGAAAPLIPVAASLGGLAGSALAASAGGRGPAAAAGAGAAQGAMQAVQGGEAGVAGGGASQAVDVTAQGGGGEGSFLSQGQAGGPQPASQPGTMANQIAGGQPPGQDGIKQLDQGAQQQMQQNTAGGAAVQGSSGVAAGPAGMSASMGGPSMQMAGMGQPPVFRQPYGNDGFSVASAPQTAPAAWGVDAGTMGALLWYQLYADGDPTPADAGEAMFNRMLQGRLSA